MSNAKHYERERSESTLKTKHKTDKARAESMKAIKSNLQDSILHHEAKGIFMHCEICESRYSADSGDYWNLPDEHEFTCCNEVMELVRETRQLIPVK